MMGWLSVLPKDALGLPFLFLLNIENILPHFEAIHYIYYQLIVGMHQCMASGGFRLGAWDYLRWRHVSPITDDNAEVITAKITIYADEPEEYYSFITPQAG
jgi:hypothetical protein